MDRAWHWAYKEQLALFYAHDAYWIECAKRRWGDTNDLKEFSNFLRSYGLIRGKLAPYFCKRESLQQFRDACNQHFSDVAIGLSWEQAQDIWNSINDKLKLPSKAPSATLKSFWFYRPESLPMYDRYTRAGLELELKSKMKMKMRITPENYLLAFGEFYNKIASTAIDCVETNIKQKYISRPRVADKYLWLIGSGNAKDILRNFESAETMLGESYLHLIPTSGSTATRQRAARDPRSLSRRKNMSRSITKFISNDNLWQEINARVSNGKTVKAAVAYLGQKGSQLLPLKKGDTLVIDMSLGTVRAGVTDPREVRKLINKGVKVFSRGSLHAKFIIIDKTLIASSANISNNSNKKLDEVGIITTDSAAIKRAIDFFEKLCTEPVREQYLKACIKAYNPKPFNVGKPSQQKGRIRQAKLWFILALEISSLPRRKRNLSRGSRRKLKKNLKILAKRVSPGFNMPEGRNILTMFNLATG